LSTMLRRSCTRNLVRSTARSRALLPLRVDELDSSETSSLHNGHFGWLVYHWRRSHFTWFLSAFFFGRLLRGFSPKLSYSDCRFAIVLFIAIRSILDHNYIHCNSI
jgi:hypothetical protein